jgi:hypothetical protein
MSRQMRPSLSDNAHERELGKRGRDSGLTDVRMVYLSQKPDLRGRHGVLFWQEELELEYAL